MHEATFLCALPAHYALDSKTLHYPTVHTTKTTSSNCKIPPGASFYQHQPLVYWTSDRGLRRACWNAISASQTRERSFASCQTRGTKGSAEIRHLHTKHKGVMSHKGTDEAWFFGAGTEKDAAASWQLIEPGQEFSDLWSTRQPAVGFFSITLFAEHRQAHIRDKYRLNLTATITFTICSVLGCWHWSLRLTDVIFLGGDEVEVGGATGPHAVAQSLMPGLFATGHVTRAKVIHTAIHDVLHFNKTTTNKTSRRDLCGLHYLSHSECVSSCHARVGCKHIPPSQNTPLICMQEPRGPCKQARSRVKDIVQRVPLRLSPHTARRLKAKKKKKAERADRMSTSSEKSWLTCHIHIHLQCNIFLGCECAQKGYSARLPPSTLPHPRMQTNSPFPFHEAFVALQRNFGPQTSQNGTSQQKCERGKEREIESERERERGRSRDRERERRSLPQSFHRECRGGGTRSGRRCWQMAILKKIRDVKGETGGRGVRDGVRKKKTTNKHQKEVLEILIRR